jgi:hypothetical protein
MTKKLETGSTCRSLRDLPMPEPDGCRDVTAEHLGTITAFIATTDHNPSHPRRVRGGGNLVGFESRTRANVPLDTY